LKSNAIGGKQRRKKEVTLTPEAREEEGGGGGGGKVRTQEKVIKLNENNLLRQLHIEGLSTPRTFPL
jgi:hypothetical protein